MGRSNHARYLVAGVAAIAIAVLVVSPALGGPSLRKLVKKEVAKQLAGKTGPQGPKGAPGGTGGQGPPGPTASGTGTADPEPDTTDIGGSFTNLVTVTVNTTTTSRVIGDASMTFGGTAGTDVECRITVDGTQAGLIVKERIAQAFHAVSLSQGAVVGAGSHTVAANCRRSSGSGTIAYTQGNITAIAAAA